MLQARPLQGHVTDLPIYAAPLDPAAIRITSPLRPGLRSSTAGWSAAATQTQRSTTIHRTPHVTYGRIVAREHPWFDRTVELARDARRRARQFETPVTQSNAPISLRCGVAATDAGQALGSSAGPVVVGSASLTFDHSTAIYDAATGSTSVRGEVRMPYLTRGRIRIIATVQVWSSTRSDIVLVPTGRRYLHYPRRWFAVGFTLLEEARRQLIRSTPNDLQEPQIIRAKAFPAVSR